MELNWPTFILEVVNFLVLVWILKRFLYKPILAAMERRKAAIEQTLSAASEQRSQAEALEAQYRRRLEDWEGEKAGLRAKVVEEVAKEREVRRNALEKALSQEREKAQVLEERRMRDLEKQAEDAAVSAGAAFTARLLERAAGPFLDQQLLALALEDLSALPPEQRQSLREACAGGGTRIRVITGFPLPPDRQQRTAAGLQNALDSKLAVDFEHDQGLLAGARILVGPWVLRANLADELQFFAEASRNGIVPS